jgi:rhamnulokinase
MSSFAAIDLGATSGRVAVGTILGGAISYEIIHRFPNGARENESGSFVWDWDELVSQVKVGLIKAAEKYSLTSVGVDTWAVDYILVDSNNQITAPTYSYRDLRTDGVMELAITDHGKEALYKTTGIQFLPFNTVYQLIAARDAGELESGRTFVMLPDAINMALTGSRTVEITNASSTQLLNARTRSWDTDLIKQLKLPQEVFPELHEAKALLGTVKEIQQLTGVKVVAVGSHDTASAVAAAPISSHSIYISSGTWSLIGCESTEPNTSAAALAVNLTNELGVEGTVRLLKNVAGMWIISECLREWNEVGDPISVEELVQQARQSESSARINPNDESFLHPGKMVERIQYQVRVNGGEELKSKGEIAYVVYASLAESYAKTIAEIESVTNRRFTNIHVVGGGSSNEFLNQLTADATGLEVIAGPVEATLLGNVGVQAIAAGQIKNLKELREIISHSFDLKSFQPSINSKARG